jgi:CheY-like chemotaxis protein
MGSIDPKNRGAVLIVDDEEDLRSEVRELLETEHYFVLEADDGAKALDTLRSGAASAVSLIVLDLLMPCMSGWEFLDVLRHDAKLSHIPVLVTSGLPVHGDASGIGATMPWIRKPFTAEGLVAAVNGLLEQSPQRDDDGPSAPQRSGRAATSSHPDG